MESSLVFAKISRSRCWHVILSKELILLLITNVKLSSCTVMVQPYQARLNGLGFNVWFPLGLENSPKTGEHLAVREKVRNLYQTRKV